jgi:HEAT repeat protein/DNA replication protein DnaC
LTRLSHHQKLARSGFAEAARIIHHIQWEYHFESYLEKVYLHLSELPLYYPANFNFDRIRQQVRVTQKRHYKEEEERQKHEETRHTGLFENSSEKERRHFVEQLDANPNEKLHKITYIQDWDEIRYEIRRAVLLGDPGYGKSWLLKYEGRRIIREQLIASSQGILSWDDWVLPIYLYLNTFADELVTTGLSESEAIVQRLKRTYDLPERFLVQIKRKLARSQCIFLLDALDEVTEDRWARLIGALRWLAENTQCAMLLTSRIAGYQGVPFPLRDEKSERELELLAFGEEQVVAFVESWFGQERERGQRLQETLRHEPALRSLARIPLLLSFLCRISSVERVIPTNRAVLYETILRLLLEGSWRTSRLHKRDEGRLELKLALLARIAWHSAADKGYWRNQLSTAEIHAVLQQAAQEGYMLERPPHLLLRELSEDDGVMVRAGIASWEIGTARVPFLFLHRTLHEYLVARYLSDKPFQVWQMLLEPHLWFDHDWEEVILLMAGCLNDPDALLQILLAEPNDVGHTMLLLAGHCLSEVDRMKVKQELVEQIIQRLLMLSHSPSNWERFQAIRVLGKLADPRIREALLTIILHIDVPTRFHIVVPDYIKEAAEGLKRIGDATTVDKLIEVLQNMDMHIFVRLVAADVLVKIADPRSVERLLQALGKEWSDMVFRQDYLRTWIEDYFGVTNSWETPLTQWQKNISSTIEDYFGVTNPWETPLTQWQKNISSTERGADQLQSFPSTRAATDALLHPDESIRRTAVAALDHFGDQWTIPYLVRAVLRDQAWQVRTSAATALKQFERASVVEPALEMLRHRDWNIDISAIEGLESIGLIDNQYVLAVVLSIMLNKNEDVRVRKAAINALSRTKNAQVEEGLLTLLNDRSMQYLHEKNIGSSLDHLHLCQQAAEALGEVGGPRAAKALFAVLDNEFLSPSAEEALKKLVQTCDPLGFYVQLAHVWSGYGWILLSFFLSISEKNHLRIMFYDLLMELLPRLCLYAGNDWPIWRARLMRYTLYMLDLQAKQKG